VRKGNAVSGPNRILYGLVFLAMFMSLGHHIDHVIRGNHAGWPLTEDVTPFTYSLGVYPLIILGLYLYASRRVGEGYWPILSGTGALFVAWIHFGPAAVEPPHRHHQPLRAADHRLAGLCVARGLCRGARGDMSVRRIFVVPSA
jgi:hypothetical protein